MSSIIIKLIVLGISNLCFHFLRLLFEHQILHIFNGGVDGLRLIFKQYFTECIDVLIKLVDFQQLICGGLDNFFLKLFDLLKGNPRLHALFPEQSFGSDLAGPEQDINISRIDRSPNFPVNQDKPIFLVLHKIKIQIILLMINHQSIYQEIEANKKIQGSKENMQQKLFDYITKRKHQMSNTFENIMVVLLQQLQYINLCFSLNRQQQIRQALKYYRNITQNQYTQSLQRVLSHYRKHLIDLFQSSTQDFNIQEIKDYEDIEQEQSPDQLFAYSFRIQEKKQRDKIRMAMKCYWEGFKNIIETVRTNSKLDQFYAKTIQIFCHFAYQRNRRVQFKRFCDYMKSHFNNLVSKYKKNQFEIYKQPVHYQIQKPEHNEINIQIRIKQFETALKLGLWSECFQLLQDINLLMKIRKGHQKKSTLSRYFQCLSNLFQKSIYSLYYAFSFYNHYIYFRKQQKRTMKQISKKTDELILAILSIFGSQQYNQSQENKSKICSLITSSNHVPSKTQLINSIKKLKVIDDASPLVKKLWILMEQKYNVLQIKAQKQLIQKICKPQDKLATYLQYNVIFKALINLESIYISMKLSRLYEIIPYKPGKIKKIMMYAQEINSISFKIDQENDKVVFENKDIVISYQEIINFCVKVKYIADQISIKIPTKQYVEEEMKFAEKMLEHRRDANKEFLKYQRQLTQQELRKQRKKQMQQNEAKRLEQQRIQLLQKEQNKTKQNIEKEIVKKKKIIKQIVQNKKNLVITYQQKKIQQLERNQLIQIDLKEIQSWLKIVNEKIDQEQSKKLFKVFQKNDYHSRKKRQMQSKILKQQKQNQQPQTKSKEVEQRIAKFKEYGLFDHINTIAIKQNQKSQNKYTNQFATFIENIKMRFQKEIVDRAKIQFQLKKKKEQEDKLKKQKQNQLNAEKNTIKRGVITFEQKPTEIKRGQFKMQNAGNQIKRGQFKQQTANKQIRRGQIKQQLANKQIRRGQIKQQLANKQIRRGQIKQQLANKQIRRGQKQIKRGQKQQNANKQIKRGQIQQQKTKQINKIQNSQRQPFIKIKQKESVGQLQNKKTIDNQIKRGKIPEKQQEKQIVRGKKIDKNTNVEQQVTNFAKHRNEKKRKEN